MKQLFMLTAIIIFTVTANAQTDIASLKSNEANLKHQETLIKKEKKKDSKELKKLEGKQVSYKAKETFYKDFGNLPAKWTRTLNFDEASFKKDGKMMRAFYDMNADLVGTLTDASFKDLPKHAQQVINKKYTNYSKSAVLLFDDNELNDTDMLLYDQQFDDADNYFVELKKNDTVFVVKVNMQGDVSFFKELNK
ncbi:hypothetical protein BH11BAC3_BH11BAC3_28770 [soil metagenome]